MTTVTNGLRHRVHRFTTAGETVSSPMRHRDSSDVMVRVALLCAALLSFILVQAAPGNMLSAKEKSRPPLQATGVIARLPPMPQNILVPQTPLLDDYTNLLKNQIRQIPQFSDSVIQGSGWRLGVTPMLAASWSVREQMAKEDPSKRQYLPLFMEGSDKGWGNPLKVYAMPLDSQYFKPTTANAHLLGGRAGRHTFAILGVWHWDPADAHEYFGHGPRVGLYGFATALNAHSAVSALSNSDPAQGLSHDLYRVLSVQP